MESLFCRLGALSLVLLLVGGCGLTVQPLGVTPNTDRPLGSTPGETLVPHPSPIVPSAPDTPVLREQVCRHQGVPLGWIATLYIDGGDKCPRSTDQANPYSAAVIERYSQLPLGATMTVCADQPVPQNWVREWNRATNADCPGARVRVGSPTVYVMRRVR